MLHRRAPIVATLALAIATSALAATAVVADDEARYHLPVAEGTALVVEQGNGGDLGRTDDQDHAFDFIAADAPERFEVTAARGGTVIGARGGVAAGRCDVALDGPRPACWRDVNYVLIDHGDGTSALYTHLKRYTIAVHVGQTVAAGQPLGTAGRSGWTDGVKLGFQVQQTPTWDVQGRGGWFQTASLPVAFADPDVAVQRPDGVPETGDAVVSANAGPAYEPFRFRPRPVGLPAAVPFPDGVSQELSGAYQADSPDGYGLHFEATPARAVEVHPLFGGELAYAGCASGGSASLGRTVAVSLEIEGTPYLAVHGHLTSVEPELLEADPSAFPAMIGPNDRLGWFGQVGSEEAEADDACAGAEPGAGLFVAILRGGEISSEGEIIAGTPVSPEPLVGERGYEGLAWWSGPLTAADVAESPGRPSLRWNETTPAGGTHIRYGDTVTLKARVRDTADIVQVRFRAWYPRWPQKGSSAGLDAFDPDTTWREIAVCDAPGHVTGSGNLCEWKGDARDAKVTYVWDPTVAKPQPSAPWLPRARAPISQESRACVPVSLAVEVIDTAGHVHSQISQLPRPAGCDDRDAETADAARVLYLDPLTPPRTPASRGTRDRGWPPVYEKDPLKGAIVWRDRSDNEDGFRIYARRHWFEADCSVTEGPWKLVTSVVANKQRYRPSHKQVQDSLPKPDTGAPGALNYWEYSVSAFNAAGETKRVPVGGFLGGSEAHCDVGVGPPPELEG